MRYTAEDFRRLSLAAFPEVQDWFEENKDLLHVQMGALASIAQRAKGDGDWGTYRRVIELAEKLYTNPDSELENALNVSFLEHLDFEGPTGGTAWELMTPRLKAGWTAMEQYLDDLFDSKHGRKPRGKAGRPRRKT